MSEEEGGFKNLPTKKKKHFHLVRSLLLDTYNPDIVVWEVGQYLIVSLRIPPVPHHKHWEKTFSSRGALCPSRIKRAKNYFYQVDDQLSSQHLGFCRPGRVRMLQCSTKHSFISFLKGFLAPYHIKAKHLHVSVVGHHVSGSPLALTNPLDYHSSLKQLLKTLWK